MKFSICLIAKNESKTLPRLMASLNNFRSCGGEVLLLDTGSTDGTPDVARSLGCTVHEVGEKFIITLEKGIVNKINKKFGDTIVSEGDRIFDYSSARNYIAEKSPTDMIAMPDCDEVYTKLDIDKIEKCIDEGAEQFEYNFVFAHDENGKAVTKFVHSKFYNRTKLHWEGVIHEVLRGDAKRTFLNEDVIKLEHWQNQESNRSHYLTGLAYDCYMNPDNDRNSHYFGRELMYKGKFKTAIKELERHIAMNKWQTEAAQSMIYIGDCHHYLGNEIEMFGWYMKAFDKEPNRRESLMKLAEHYYRLKKSKQAVAYALAALSIKGISYYSNVIPYYEHIPHEILYWGLWYEGDREKAKEHFNIAFSMFPTNPKYIEDQKFFGNDLQFTGERVVPDKMEKRPDILEEHLTRYNFIKDKTKGKKVLDAACGSGYGKEILGAREYVGIDISQDAIDYARSKYGEGYFVEDLEKGVSLNIYPDVVVSFETIEHLENPENFLKWVATHSKEFIFSIPVNMPSEFHKKVYSVDQIKELIGKYFKNVEWSGQDGKEIRALGARAKYVVGVARTELPKISIVIPTLGRPEGLARCLKSIETLHYPKSLIETIVIEDSPRLGVPARLKEGVEKSTGDWIVYGSNDIEFTSSSITEALKEYERTGKRLITFNTGEVYADEGNICEHFMIKKDLIPLIGGEIFDIELSHVGVDNLLWEKCKKLNEATRADMATVFHYHFSKGYPMDEVYSMGWNHVDADRTLLKEKLLKI